jgi:hypothetical protein
MLNRQYRRGDQQVQDLIHAEAHISARLRHPHLIPTVDFGFEEEVPYLVMMDAMHGTLRTLYPRSFQVSPPRVVWHVRHIAQAPFFAHRGRADIHPEEMTRDLPFVYLVDVLRDPLAFRFRLVGTRVSVWSGKDYTGATLNAAEYGPSWKIIFEAYREIVERRAPTAAELFAPWRMREFQYYERFLAPLAEDGQTVTMIFGALHTIDPPKAV